METKPRRPMMSQIWASIGIVKIKNQFEDQFKNVYCKIPMHIDEALIASWIVLSRTDLKKSREFLYIDWMKYLEWIEDQAEANFYKTYENSVYIIDNVGRTIVWKGKDNSHKWIIINFV